MSILRALGYTLLGGICLAAVGLVASVLFLLVNKRPIFDRSHPDYDRFDAVFTMADRAFNEGKTRVVIDFAPMNGGAWRTACLFSGYGHPVQKLESLGAAVGQIDRDRLATAKSLRAAPVEETEAAIGFVDEQGRAHFIHFERGLGQWVQGYSQCVTKPDTSLVVSD